MRNESMFIKLWSAESRKQIVPFCLTWTRTITSSRKYFAVQLRSYKPFSLVYQKKKREIPVMFTKMLYRVIRNLLCGMHALLTTIFQRHDESSPSNTLYHKETHSKKSSLNCFDKSLQHFARGLRVKA